MWNSKRRITSSDSNQSKPTSLRHLFKQNSLSTSFTAPIRLAPHWNRVLRFGNTTKFKSDEFFKVNLLNVSIIKYASNEIRKKK